MPYPSFAELLPGLLTNRSMTLADLPDHDPTTPPTPDLLRRLAPVLGLHTADLFLIAWEPLPDDLLPCEVTKGSGWIPSLVCVAMNLPPDRRSKVRDLARSLPQEAARRPVPSPPAHEHYEPSAGALLLRLLHTRNLNWMGAARAMLYMGGLYRAASTVGGVGRGRLELTVDLAASLGRALDISEADLTVLTGVTIPDGMRGPAATDVAELIWDLRRLTADQVQWLAAEAERLAG